MESGGCTYGSIKTEPGYPEKEPAEERPNLKESQ